MLIQDGQIVGKSLWPELQSCDITKILLVSCNDGPRAKLKLL